MVFFNFIFGGCAFCSVLLTYWFCCNFFLHWFALYSLASKSKSLVYIYLFVRRLYIFEKTVCFVCDFNFARIFLDWNQLKAGRGGKRERKKKTSQKKQLTIKCFYSIQSFYIYFRTFTFSSFSHFRSCGKLHFVWKIACIECFFSSSLRFALLYFVWFYRMVMSINVRGWVCSLNFICLLLMIWALC